MCEVVGLSKKILDAVKKMVGLIVGKYVIVGSQTVVHSPSSELRGPVVVDT